MLISNDIKYIGVDDHLIDLFEGQYPAKNGMSYNSYLIADDKIAVMDTVDSRFAEKWMDMLIELLDGRKPDYLVVHHMEPDHCGSLGKFMQVYPDTRIVGNKKTFSLIGQFFRNTCYESNYHEVENGATLCLGSHELEFIFAPMIHWPEVMFSYEKREKILFSADAFGKFGASDVKEEWADEARRYYYGIVGKYGVQVTNVLKQAAQKEIERICPLHGPMLLAPLEPYLKKYQMWSAYEPEEKGILVAYASMYGNTKQAAELLAENLKDRGCTNIRIMDIARSDVFLAVSQAFRYSALVLASPTYNGGVFPCMRHFAEYLSLRNYRNRTVGLIENGSWAPAAAKQIREIMQNCRDVTWLEPSVKIVSALSEENRAGIEAMAEELKTALS